MPLEPATRIMAKTARTTGILGAPRSEKDSTGLPSTRESYFYVPINGVVA